MASPYRFWYYQAPAFLFALGIFVASSLPHVPTPRLDDFPLDKAAHLVVFAVFGYLVLRAFRHAGRAFFNQYCLAWSWLVGIIWALGDEWHQSFVPGRYADAKDLLADWAGVGLILLWQYYLRRTRGN